MKEFLPQLLIALDSLDSSAARGQLLSEDLLGPTAMSLNLFRRQRHPYRVQHIVSQRTHYWPSLTIARICHIVRAASKVTPTTK